MKVCSCSPQRQNKSILSFLAPPHQPASAKVMLDNNPGKSAAVGLLLLPPRLQTLLPSPDQLPRPLCSARLGQAGLRPAPKTNGTGPDGCLPELDMFPPVEKVMWLWYMCFCAEVFFFSVLTLYSPMEHSLGVNFFFSSLSSCKCCIFLPFPVFLFCLPRCHVCCVCMNGLMANFAGTCD